MRSHCRFFVQILHEFIFWGLAPLFAIALKKSDSIILSISNKINVNKFHKKKSCKNKTFQFAKLWQTSAYFLYRINLWFPFNSQIKWTSLPPVEKKSAMKNDNFMRLLSLYRLLQNISPKIWRIYSSILIFNNIYWHVQSWIANYLFSIHIISLLI